MQDRKHVFGALGFAGVLLLSLAPGQATARSASAQIEPHAGTWLTWVLTSGSQLRLAPPPDRAASVAEVNDLKSMAQQRDAAARESIAFWDTGAPGYRWDALARNELFKHGTLNASATTSRQLSLVDVAIYDATIAAWDSKYAYNRPRPVELDPTLDAVIATPDSPSYPSEHAAAAGAAAAVLAYLFPDDAESFATMANEAARSRVLAGVQYPSDTSAGLELGRQVGALVIDRARHDGSQVPWDGTLPIGPDLWSLDGYPDGTVPIAPNFGSFKPWVLESGSQLRPGPPPAPDSDQKAAELAELKDTPLNFVMTSTAFYWQSVRANWPLVVERELFESRLDQNPPRAARAAALVQIAAFDATIACWDAKFTYMAKRPFQLDPELRPLFQTPAHPSYPAAHGCLSGAQSAALAWLFPADATALNAAADEAATSRLWARIHFRSDIDVGLAMGRAIGNMVAERGQV